MIVQILKGEEVIREIEDDNPSILQRAKLDAEVMTRDLDGEYSAREKPNEEIIDPDIPA